jgi:hypothetical protein
MVANWQPKGSFDFSTKAAPRLRQLRNGQIGGPTS